MIKTFWEKLDAKQRKLVAGATILVLIALILEIAVFPFWAAKAKLTKAIQVNQKKLNEMSKLDAEFTLQEAAMARIKSALSARSAGKKGNTGECPGKNQTNEFFKRDTINFFGRIVN
jgi:type II secretory pathway component PulM